MVFRGNYEILEETEDKKNIGLCGNIWGMFLILLLLSTFCINNSTGPVLIENLTLRSHSAIYRNIVVWEDLRNGKYDESELENLISWLENLLAIRIIIILAAIITVFAATVAGTKFLLSGKYRDWHEKSRIYNWLYNETKGYRNLTVGFPPKGDPRWKTSMEIANSTNLSIERVQYLCRIHDKIVAMPKNYWPNEPSKDFWAIKDFAYI